MANLTIVPPLCMLAPCRLSKRGVFRSAWAIVKPQTQTWWYSDNCIRGDWTRLDSLPVKTRVPVGFVSDHGSIVAWRA